MALERLTKAKIERAKPPAKLSDGGGLVLRLYEDGRRYWYFRYQPHFSMLKTKTSKEMGLGAYPALSLEAARREAKKWRERYIAGGDPIESRRNERLQAHIAKAKTVTFKTFAENYIDSHKSAWSNSKHADQWRNTLTTYAFPKIGHLPISAIDVHLILAVLEQRSDEWQGTLWSAKPETASRLRGRLEKILDAAIFQKRHAGPNPALWKGGLATSLASPRARKRRSHPALPYAEIATFMAALAKQPGIGARALEFTVLTAARTSEVLKSRWREFDLDHRVWNIPAERMKAREPHRVALSEDALAVLGSLGASRNPDDYVFPGREKGTPPSNMTMKAVLKRMGKGEITPHGFRTTFRTWAAERTQFPREVVEAALSHVIANPTEAAYLRTDLLPRRVKLMEAWAHYCRTKAVASADVLPFKAAKEA